MPSVSLHHEDQKIERCVRQLEFEAAKKKNENTTCISSTNRQDFILLNKLQFTGAV